LLKRRSSHSVAVNSPHFRDNPKIRRFCRLMFHRSLRCVACVVVEFHSSHSFIILQVALFDFPCVVVEFHSSHSFDSLLLIFVIFFFVVFENSTGIGVI
jgi:hypothetical protein